jgi:hypothetical protein
VLNYDGKNIVLLCLARPNFGQEKSGDTKSPLSFGWDTSKLQKITLFQARRSAPLHRTTVRYNLCRYRASFGKLKFR